MQKLIVFNNVSLDGYFVDAKGSMYWARAAERDKEWDDFVAENASGGGTLLFGRVTYEMMSQYWPSAEALRRDRVVAEGMNNAPKVVFSRTLERASWNNTRLVKSDLVGEVRKMKDESSKGMCILGSGTIVSQLAQAGLIDEFQVVVNPVALGAGRTMFEGVKEKLNLKQTKTRAFANGYVFLSYVPAA
jgi:dihydrofolate reductase